MIRAFPIFVAFLVTLAGCEDPAARSTLIAADTLAGAARSTLIAADTLDDAAKRASEAGKEWATLPNGSDASAFLPIGASIAASANAAADGLAAARPRAIAASKLAAAASIELAIESAQGAADAARNCLFVDATSHARNAAGFAREAAAKMR